MTSDVAGGRARAEKNMADYGTIPSYRAALDREGIDNPVDLAADRGRGVDREAGH
ncbi:hypothetical protein [Saccharopolyspora pogona]|uniref:hypothetical protein n=1 Tax=Saccharopolyspora pogona TaxID=333966 RepID=UPI001683A1E1|nr:hypothetical protein [Saccharopolyspora pogona]